jgi:hypothetical protein
LIRSCPEDQGMTLHQGTEGVIATANHTGHGNLSTKTGIKYEMIALQKSQIGQAKPT